MWTMGNEPIHAMDDDGLNVAEGIQLQEGTVKQYLLGKDGFLVIDRKHLDIILKTTLW